jgi:hypothetical protein
VGRVEGDGDIGGVGIPLGVLHRCLVFLRSPSPPTTCTPGVFAHGIASTRIKLVADLLFVYMAR